MRAYADGAAIPFADVTFNIGEVFLSAVGNPSRTLGNFPAAPGSTEVTWSEPHQGVL